jgi:hypothetical protein
MFPRGTGKVVDLSDHAMHFTEESVRHTSSASDSWNASGSTSAQLIGNQVSCRPVAVDPLLPTQCRQDARSRPAMDEHA